jgi:aspartyl-tRNA synthetase
LAGEDDIRDVITFTKTKTASDSMTGAPSPVAEEQLRVLGIRVVEEPDAE